MTRISRTTVATVMAAVALTTYVLAAQSSKKEARVTRIIREVNLLPAEEKPVPASLNDQVREGTAVRTGDDSKSELTFLDLTITRLGENSVFSFNKAGRSVDLTSGSILLRVPKDSGGATIRTSGVTAGIAGTTVILEAPGSGRNKLLVLEGHARLTLRKYSDQSKEVRAGQMLDVPSGARTLPDPVAIDLQQIMRSHPLIKDFAPLPSEPLITQEIQKQTPAYAAAPQRPASSLGGLRVPPSSLPPTRPPTPPPQTGGATGGSTTVPPGTGGGAGGGTTLPPSGRPPRPGAPTTGGATTGGTTLPPGGKRPRPGGPTTGVGTVTTAQPTTPTPPPVILKGGSPTPAPGFKPPFYNAIGPAAGSAQTQAQPTASPRFPGGQGKNLPGRTRKRPTPPPIR